MSHDGYSSHVIQYYVVKRPRRNVKHLLNLETCLDIHIYIFVVTSVLYRVVSSAELWCVLCRLYIYL